MLFLVLQLSHDLLLSSDKNHGIDVWAVTVQNEPEFPAPWEVCISNEVFCLMIVY